MRTLIILASFFLLLAASCGGGARDESPVVNFPEQVPESVRSLETDDGRQVQDLIQTAQSDLSSGDLTGYYNLHSSAFRSSCPFDEFSAGMGQFSGLGSPNQEIYFHSVEIEGDSALIYYDLGGNRTSQELIEQNGRWWLVPAINCQGRLELFKPGPTPVVDPNLWEMIDVKDSDLSRIAFHPAGSFWVTVPFSIVNEAPEYHTIRATATYTVVADGSVVTTECYFGEDSLFIETGVSPGTSTLGCVFHKDFGSGLAYQNTTDFADITNFSVSLTSIDGMANPALTGK